MPKSTPPPGTSDITPEETPQWLLLENTARRIFSLYGYGELRTPVMEYTEVFQRGLGDDTDVVKKEMYTFEDKGGRSLTLRPEGTAGVMRSLSGTDALNGVEHRVFYIGPMFRGERPAAGRRRQFHQIGVENAGRVSPELDAECIAMLIHYLGEIGITGVTLKLNTRGVKADRPAAETALRNYFAPQIAGMCEDCRDRLNRNIWRILDCKQEACRRIIENAPDAAQFFGEETKTYFKRVCSALTAMGVSYEIDKKLVRGLDYYVHTVFELSHPALGDQIAIAGGGRYELLLPGESKPIQGVGFACGMERLLMLREALKIEPPKQTVPDIFLVSMGEKALAFNTKLASALRRLGISTGIELEQKSMKSQMRSADRLKARYTLTVGDNELASGKAQLKKMEDASLVPADSLDADAIAKLLRPR